MAEADKDDTHGRALAEPAPHLAALSEKARDYARNARSENTQKAYDADWRQFASWLRRQGLDPLPTYIPPHEDPQTQPALAARYLAGREDLREVLPHLHLVHATRSVP